MEPYLAMIMAFGGNFQIRGWLFCNGQILSIAQNTALFSILGTTYGGNGQTTFALPDLRGRAAVGWGQAPGLGNYSLGEVTGTTSTTLTIGNMPAHNHVADLSQATSIPSASTAPGTTSTPANNMVPAKLPNQGTGPGALPITGYAAQDNTTTLAPGKVGGTIQIGISGGTQPFSIQNPILAISYLIATAGIFPSRN
ncbi:phage tail protein [Chitinophaga agrisoli]|uniref:Phage tail protein n=1 Tax=Chitinophaga agrisoli TaxID=2607653 RepID=A0A5B2VKT5_9BACT|nr:tail fiber protein [Chitinophaga agrisoli]KAA2238902.1 phage tail protein [Chitinophaga agrisoli]